MSRTIRGSKGVGYEYWSRRPHSKSSVIGKHAKRYTIKAERIIERRIILRELESVGTPIMDKFKVDMGNFWKDLESGAFEFADKELEIAKNIVEAYGLSSEVKNND